VTAIASDVDFVSAPKNYAAVFEQYYPYVVNLCGTFGIDDNNKEDVAQEILLKFIKRNSLEKFDPDRTFEYRGTMRPARFKNYLSRAVDYYCRGYRDRQKKLARREVLICDTTPKPSQRMENINPTAISSQASWSSVFGEVVPDHADGVNDMIDEAAEANGIRAILAEVPRRSAHDRCDLVALYDAVRAQILAYGEYDIPSLREKFGVSTTAMHGWMWWLKEVLADIYGLPMPTRRPHRSRFIWHDEEQP
jgi:DNA-directed RNA polymerase specialized sigma24 family protein